MFGAALGDIVGSLYEFDPIKRKDFPFLEDDMSYTDDTIMTAAVLEALMESDISDEETTKKNLVRRMKEWGRRYPHPTGAYGSMFSYWLHSPSPEPYGSWGNGSAMRVSGAGWLYDTIEETRKAARLSAEVTHNHEEGIKGAEATASAIFLGRNGGSKEEIKAYMDFVTALCRMAKEAKRITGKDKPVENEKYAFRCFLLRLGFIGDDYKQSRKILLQNFSGSSAWKSGTPTKEVQA